MALFMGYRSPKPDEVKKCPGCGKELIRKTVRKDGQRYQMLTCLSCATEYPFPQNA